MTPEEILAKYFTERTFNAHDAHRQAIEAIQQYAREMCDKQKESCLQSYCNDIDGQLTPNQKIANSPYPKELQ